ncbi:MAG: ribosome silencing factor [Micavibrio sp.]|nr:ribosome silencing factor [Micavibrio sp.]
MKKAAAPAAKKAGKAAPEKKAAATPDAKAGANAPHKLHELIMKIIDMDKGEDVVSINLAGKTAIADYMIIVTGTSSRQVISMAERIRDKLATEKFRARIEGKESGDWVIVDAGDVIVHLFRAEVREFYNLEKLWAADFSTVDYTLYHSA